MVLVLLSMGIDDLRDTFSRARFLTAPFEQSDVAFTLCCTITDYGFGGFILFPCMYVREYALKKKAALGIFQSSLYLLEIVPSSDKVAIIAIF